jgi:integrase
MPRKPKVEKKTITVIVNTKPVAVILHPPTKSRKSWYAYWPGLVTSKSTGREKYEDAVVVAEEMVKSGGKKPTVTDAVLTDQEFEKIQRTHYARKTGASAQARSAKSLEDCLDAITAFKAITCLPHIVQATADDCARFQAEAVDRPVNWRKQFPKSKKTDQCLSANTVLKWSRSLQAAFERVNRGAGKKCVRGVVAETKLLNANPWAQFTWIEGTSRPIRPFDAAELLGFLTYLDTSFPTVPAATLAAKVFLWSCCRKLEVAGLTWDALRVVGTEFHFEVEGKWGVKRWFQVPEALYRELIAHRAEDRYVFSGYSEQIRRLHANNAGCLKKIRDQFTPDNFGRWFYERVKEWSTTLPGGKAYVHLFRKTGLQFAHDGEEEDVSQKVASDAGVSHTVLLNHYVVPKLWRQSSRTYRRLLASLPAEVARRYGYEEGPREQLERELGAARTEGRWSRVAELAALLDNLSQADKPAAG